MHQSYAVFLAEKTRFTPMHDFAHLAYINFALILLNIKTKLNIKNLLVLSNM